MENILRILYFKNQFGTLMLVSVSVPGVLMRLTELSVIDSGHERKNVNLC